MKPAWFIRLEFKPQDLWVGIFWKRDDWLGHPTWEAWVCILPMLPIHFGKTV